MIVSRTYSSEISQRKQTYSDFLVFLAVITVYLVVKTASGYLPLRKAEKTILEPFLTTRRRARAPIHATSRPHLPDHVKADGEDQQLKQDRHPHLPPYRSVCVIAYITMIIATISSRTSIVILLQVHLTPTMTALRRAHVVDRAVVARLEHAGRSHPVGHNVARLAQQPLLLERLQAITHLLLADAQHEGGVADVCVAEEHPPWTTAAVAALLTVAHLTCLTFRIS